MPVPEKRRRIPASARIVGTVSAAVAATLIVVPGAHATTAAASQTSTSVVSSEAPAPAETVVSVQDAEMVYGSTGQLQATVETADGDPVTSGEVTFLLNGRTQTADVTDGAATVPVTTEDFGSVHGYPLNHGGYWYRATYTGENYTDAEASAKLQVVQADPALDATITPEAVPGEPVTIEGRVTAQPDHEGQPQGSLQLSVDGEQVGEPVRVAEDDGSFSTEFTAPESWEPGEHTVELTLPRHGNFNAATFTLTTTVVPSVTETVVTVQDAEMVYGSTGQLQATVETADGDPVTSGEVTFLLNGRTQTADVTDGVATVDVTTEDFGSVHGYPLNHGGYWFRATYTGENYTDAEASAKLQVIKAPVQLDAALSEDEIEAGETVTIEGQVTAQPGNEGQPQGSLQLSVDGESVGDPIRVDASGNFSTEYTTPEDWAAGEHTIGLEYDASANFTATSADLTVTVEEADSGPGSIWEAIEQALRDLFGWLWWLFGGR